MKKGGERRGREVRGSDQERGERGREGGNLNLNINNPEGTKTSKKVWKHLNRYFLWKKKYIEEANRNG